MGPATHGEESNPGHPTARHNIYNIDDIYNTREVVDLAGLSQTHLTSGDHTIVDRRCPPVGLPGDEHS